MSTLYEITGQYLELYKMMESADNLEMKVITDTLDGMDGELEEKADGYAKIALRVVQTVMCLPSCRNMRVSRSGKHFWNWAGSTRTGRMNVGLPASAGDMNFKSGGRKRRERFVRKRKRRRHCVRKQSSCGYVCACLNRFRMHGVNVITSCR